MESSLKLLAAAIRHEILPCAGVTRLSSCRRFASVYSNGSSADSLYFLDSGLVKLSRHDGDTKEIIIDLVTPDRLFGEEALQPDQVHAASAVVLQEGAVFAIPRDVFLRVCNAQPTLWPHFAATLSAGKRRLEKKIEMLGLSDVESRIVFYLNDMADTVGVRVGAVEFSVGLSQGELGNLVGATRETTSTTLNSLARRGLIKLGRRQLIVVKPDASAQPKTHSYAAAAL